MTRWLEIRDKLPPEHLSVLLYIRDEIDGYTEDFMCQGYLIEVVDEVPKFCLSCGEMESCHKVAYWTLLPEAPISWR